jgi:deoxynucleoside triphosphate triphosphohydrolase SAMHD1
MLSFSNHLSLPFHKSIKDVVFGQIEVTKEELSLIDTPHYQALRDLKQLGFCVSLVYPSATHTRFQHSLQVCHVSSILLSHLNRFQPELNIDTYLLRHIRVAALMHDIGHIGLVNHYFDEMCSQGIISGVPENMRHHEDRSCLLLAYLLRTRQQSETTEDRQLDVDLICHMIKGVYKEGCPKWWFEIVANHFHEIDTDKLCYLTLDSKAVGFSDSVDIQRLFLHARIIDDHLVFAEKVGQMCYDVFQLRQKLHREVYQHRVVLVLQMMVGDLMALLFEGMRYDLLFGAEDHHWRILFNDSMIHFIPQLVTMPLDLSKSAYGLYCRIMSRDLYPIESKASSGGRSEQREERKSNNNIPLYPAPCVLTRQVQMSLSGSGRHPFESYVCYRKTKDNSKREELVTLKQCNLSVVNQEIGHELLTITCNRRCKPNFSLL